MQKFCNLTRNGIYLIDNPLDILPEMHTLPVSAVLLMTASGMTAHIDPCELRLAEVNVSCTCYGDLWIACAEVGRDIVGEIRFYTPADAERTLPLRVVEHWIRESPRVRFMLGGVYEDMASALEAADRHVTGSALVRATCVW